MTFSRFIDALIDEKGINREQILEVEGPSGLNLIPLEVVIDTMKQAPAQEQREMRSMLAKIEFYNGDILDYLKHLAQAIAQ